MSAVDLHSLAAVVDSRRRSSHLLGTFDATVGCGAEEEEEEWSNKGSGGSHYYGTIIARFSLENGL